MGYGYYELIAEVQTTNSTLDTTNEKLDLIHEDLQNISLFCGALLIMVIVGVLLSIIKN